jgi:hypothetical protein
MLFCIHYQHAVHEDVIDPLGILVGIIFKGIGMWEKISRTVVDALQVEDYDISPDSYA